jgi:two-component system, chemotaxis family, protein-glutamate methylesterase/glutaminase
MSTFPIVAIGASAGGLDALTRLVAQLPAKFPAAVFIVHHMSADADGEALLGALNESGQLACTFARDGEVYERGHIYLAPPDHHLMLSSRELRVTKGARENRSRPAIDPLFRSAAVAHGNRVIGVVLTGCLDDGTSGLSAIQRCGGTCVVQDPADAAYPDMPANAMAHVKADHCVPLAQMGALLTELTHRKVGERKPVPEDIAIEAKIAERVLSDLASVEAVGDQVPFNCPNCSGVLWEIAHDEPMRFRCHTGHAFTAPVLLAEQTSKVEETLWVALRMLEERRNLLMKMSQQGTSRRGKGNGAGAHAHGNRGIYASAAERAKESEVHIDRIRTLLRESEQATGQRNVRA